MIMVCKICSYAHLGCRAGIAIIPGFKVHIISETLKNRGHYRRVSFASPLSHLLESKNGQSFASALRVLTTSDQDMVSSVKELCGIKWIHSFGGGQKCTHELAGGKYNISISSLGNSRGRG